MKRMQAIGLTVCWFAAMGDPVAAQREDWTREPLPPFQVGTPLPLRPQPPLTGTEYIRVECDTTMPGLGIPYMCPGGDPNRPDKLIPISAFARASTVFDLAARVDASFAQFAQLRKADQRSARRGIAAALAMGTASFPSAPGRTSYDFNLATFRGERAIGGSIMHRLNTAEPMAISIGFSSAGNRNHAGRVGISGEF